MLLMKINKEELLKPLQSVAGIVERRHTLPILSNVLIQISDNNVAFIATDLEIQITALLANSNDQGDSSITVSAKKLQDIVRALPENAQISFDSKDSRLQLKAGKSQFNLQTLPADDFPKLALSDELVSDISLSQSMLKHLFNQVQYAMAQQDIRYYLNGLLLVLEPGVVKVIATDGHRLSLASMKAETVTQFAEAILPRKTVTELIKLLGDTEEEVKLRLGKNLVTFTFGNINLVSKVIEGKFPDYNKVIPSLYENHVLVDRLTLLHAMQRASILSNEKFRGVRMVLTQNSMRVICNNTEQEEAEEELEINYSNEPLDIGFNVTYLLDVLNNINSKEVDCSFGDANSSCLIMVPGDDRFKYVVMPMRI
ncbi:MAG: DNA polymerase III subunit beta [Sulfurimicrobium sp.]|nr:DNA polymerase III subunit beta [Sulfurimicrobium sp.]MDP2199979.1 DNA polymerase III subunit beta [Sulfurimicrobium sp.]